MIHAIKAYHSVSNYLTDYRLNPGMEEVYPHLKIQRVLALDTNVKSVEFIKPGEPDEKYIHLYTYRDGSQLEATALGLSVM